MADEKKTSKKTDTKSKKKSDKKKSKKNPFKSIAGFFKSVNNEGKKVSWPTAKEVLKNSVTYVIDLGLTSGMKGIKQLAQKETTTASETTTEATSDETLTENTTEDTAAATTSAE